MGQKVNPNSFRLGVSLKWENNLFLAPSSYATNFYKNLNMKNIIKIFLLLKSKKRCILVNYSIYSLNNYTNYIFINFYKCYSNKKNINKFKKSRKYNNFTNLFLKTQISKNKVIKKNLSNNLLLNKLGWFNKQFLLPSVLKSNKSLNLNQSNNNYKIKLYNFNEKNKNILINKYLVFNNKINNKLNNTNSKYLYFSNKKNLINNIFLNNKFKFIQRIPKLIMYLTTNLILAYGANLLFKFKLSKKKYTNIVNFLIKYIEYKLLKSNISFNVKEIDFILMNQVFMHLSLNTFINSLNFNILRNQSIMNIVNFKQNINNNNIIDFFKVFSNLNKEFIENKSTNYLLKKRIQSLKFNDNINTNSLVINDLKLLNQIKNNNLKNLYLKKNIIIKKKLNVKKLNFSLHALKKCLNIISGINSQIFLFNAKSLFNFKDLVRDDSIKLNVQQQKVKRYFNMAKKLKKRLNKRWSRIQFLGYDLMNVAQYSLFFKNSKILASLISYQLSFLPKNKRQTAFLKYISKIIFNFKGEFKDILGLKLKFKGRFNKWKRTKKWEAQAGNLLVQTYDAFIDYASVKGLVKKGIFSVRLWIQYKKKSKYTLKNIMLNFFQYSVFKHKTL